MLTPLLVTLVLLQQAPTSPDGPISVLIAPPDTAGVPGHVVEFAQEHVAEQARAKGLTVIRMKDFIKKLPASKRKALLRCKRSDLKCLTALGAAANSEVVLVAELLQRSDGYRVGTKVYKTHAGGLVAERLITSVREDGILDALSQSLDVVVPAVVKEMRPPAAPPPVETPEIKPPDENTTGQTGQTTGQTGQTTGQTGQATGQTGQATGQTTGQTGPTGPTPGPTKPTPEEKKVSEPSAHPWAWVPGAGGIVFAGAGTYFYLQAKDKYDMLDKEGAPGSAQLDGAKLASDGRRAQTLSRVAFGLGAAGVVTSVVLYLLPAKKAPPVTPSVSVGPGGAMVGLAGTLP